MGRTHRRPDGETARPAGQPQERVMKKIALISVALAMLAATPTLARVRHDQQDQAWTYGQVSHGYYDSSRVRPGDIPFAPF
jgi:hypothetical protein